MNRQSAKLILTTKRHVQAAILETLPVRDRIDDASYRVRIALGAASYHGRNADPREQSFADVMLSAAQFWARRAWHYAMVLDGTEVQP